MTLIEATCADAYESYVSHGCTYLIEAAPIHSREILVTGAHYTRSMQLELPRAIEVAHADRALFGLLALIHMHRMHAIDTLC